MSEPIIEVKSVNKAFRSVDGSARSVLEGIDLTLNDGEIVALLGQSGSGKSTLLRIMAGLLSVDSGQVHYRGVPLYSPANGISMVFQSFALFPWLSVQKNVELGLEARGIDREERAQRANAAIKLIGLSGFENALPRELSGGMRQRVGIARALVLEPNVLLMDEAFSALDVLTGERLRDDILRLWESRQIPTKAVLVVSHNIADAVIMADRILIMGTKPGHIRDEMTIKLPRPRSMENPRVLALIDRVYGLMTQRDPTHGQTANSATRLQLGDRLPDAQIAHLEGILNLISGEPFYGHADLPKLAEEIELRDTELLDVLSAISLLGFANVSHGDILISPLGQRYVEASHNERKQLFGAQILDKVPLINYMRHGLDQDPSGDLHEELFLRLLRFTLNEDEAERVLSTAIEWGRYGDIIEYDLNTGVIRLPRPTT